MINSKKIKMIHKSGHKPAPWTTIKLAESKNSSSLKSSTPQAISEIPGRLLQSILRPLPEEEPEFITCLSCNETVARLSSFIFSISFLQVTAAPPEVKSKHAPTVSDNYSKFLPGPWHCKPLHTFALHLLFFFLFFSTSALNLHNFPLTKWDCKIVDQFFSQFSEENYLNPKKLCLIYIAAA